MSELLVFMPSAFGNFRLRKLVYYADYRFNDLYRPDPKYSGSPLPQPSGEPQYELPTVHEESYYQTKGKWNRKTLYLGVALAILCLFLAPKFFTLWVWVVVPFAYNARPKRPLPPPDPKPGDWFIGHGVSEQGHIPFGLVFVYRFKHR